MYVKQSIFFNLPIYNYFSWLKYVKVAKNCLLQTELFVVHFRKKWQEMLIKFKRQEIFYWFAFYLNCKVYIYTYMSIPNTYCMLMPTCYVQTYIQTYNTQTYHMLTSMHTTLFHTHMLNHTCHIHRYIYTLDTRMYVCMCVYV